MMAGGELDALRERWRLLCAEPGRHDLAAALAAFCASSTRRRA
ncbi:MAG TPA: hypothetical protein VFS43_17145 [Polyangiaceae bacterium]|nr:hypothetical protein [Polyangiaceae bacterium]